MRSRRKRFNFNVKRLLEELKDALKIYYWLERLFNLILKVSQKMNKEKPGLKHGQMLANTIPAARRERNKCKSRVVLNLSIEPSFRPNL
jgi:hypothetical protein